jgi:hypothetical protein
MLNNIFSEVILLKFWHVVDGLFMWVCLAPTFFSCRISLTQATFLVGSSSRLLTSSGASSEDVAATGGRSGSVVIVPSF